MPIARDRLDVIVVPADPSAELPVDLVTALFDRWQHADLLGPGTGPLRRTAGARAWALMPGGFGVLWLDRPGAPTLYANQLGGFRVPCPSCGQGLARVFGQAVRAWREGGAGLMICPSCDHQAPLAEVPLYPPGAFAKGAVIFGDAQALEPSGTALRELKEVLGGLRVILRRRS